MSENTEKSTQAQLDELAGALHIDINNKVLVEYYIKNQQPGYEMLVHLLKLKAQEEKKARTGRNVLIFLAVFAALGLFYLILYLL